MLSDIQTSPSFNCEMNASGLSLVPLPLFRSRAFSGANLLTLFLYAAFSGVLYFLPLDLIQVQGYTAAQAGAALVGQDRWTEWGTEQVASSFLLANEPGMVPLPYRRYLNYWKEPPVADARFLHFVGTHRYSTAEYRVRTRQAIAALRPGETAAAMWS